LAIRNTTVVTFTGSIFLNDLYQGELIIINCAIVLNF